MPTDNIRVFTLPDDYDADAGLIVAARCDVNADSQFENSIKPCFSSAQPHVAAGFATNKGSCLSDAS